MANVRSDLVFYLKEKKIERGYRCDQTPPGNYFEKKGSKWVDLEVKTVEEVFKKKGWKLPAAPAKKAVAKKEKKEKPAKTKKPAKKAVKKNAKPEVQEAAQEGSHPGSDEQ